MRWQPDTLRDPTDCRHLDRTGMGYILFLRTEQGISERTEIQSRSIAGDFES